MFGHGRFRADQRFVVWQGVKPRPYEKCRGSGNNDTCVTRQCIVFAPPDAAAAVGLYFFAVAEADGWTFHWEFGAAEDDKPDAYRNSAARTPAYTVFFFADSDGVVKAGVPRGLNFGLKAAVEQYCRKPALVVAFLRHVLMVPMHHYVNDFQTMEPSFCLGEEVPGAVGPGRYLASGQAMLWATYDLFGFCPLKIAKSTAWSVSAAPFVGKVSDFSRPRSDGVNGISIKEDTRAKARVIIVEALASDSLVPALAGKLYGKLRWAFCLGRLVVGALHAVKARQYAARDSGPGWTLDPELRG